VDTGVVIALSVIGGIILLVVLITLYQKQRIMEMLAYRYGRPPERDYDERDLSKNSYKMFFADEILKGTNTTERIAAASAILKRFAESDCFFCLTTHDTELTGILRNFYTNYHFKEITTNTEIRYDYKLYDGVTPRSNAIALLKYAQYAPSIVDEASGLERHYLNSKEWEVLSGTGQ